MAELDEIDHALLRLLRQDARRTFSEMAEKVGLSVAAVKRRVDRMRDLGVITGFTTQIDYSKLGWAIEAFTELRYAGSAPVSEIIRTATVAPEVQAIYTTAGDPDALVSIRARDMRHLQQVIDTLRRAGNVTGTKTLMIMDVWTRSDADPATPVRPTPPRPSTPGRASSPPPPQTRGPALP
ncbi:Lrp/AsnC family transcriptional regulator [Actinomadura harenae]|uniref:Lrp/AsnC family transcriptional regulator n=1 Tax=Actinomadura harenae TaxID=2483351 RepID=A0A3M2M468_9ACTN|nr:Lrp/AsnC family transcriptional regulator [Actinomadura harenae]RMI41888.1 Lrp/AsnC family transcriptional regulator [Actinomadura harenae]